MNWEIFKGTLRFWPAIIIGTCVAVVLLPIVFVWLVILFLVGWPILLLLGTIVFICSWATLEYMRLGRK